MSAVMCFFGLVLTGAAWSPAAAQGTPQAKGGKVIPLIGGNAIVTITPSSDNVMVSGGTTHTYQFNLGNSGTANTTASLTVPTCTGAVSNCSVSPRSVSLPANGAGAVATVTYTTAPLGTGTIILNANWPSGNNVQGTLTVTLPGAQPSITASQPTVWTQQNVNTGYPYFTIKNTGNTTAAYTLTASCTNVVAGSCSVASPSGSVAPNGTITAEVRFTTGPASGGNATVTLTATSPYSETNSQSATIVPMSEYVSVTGQTPPTPPNPNGSTTYNFTVTATGNNTSTVTYGLTASCSGALSCSTTPSPGSVGISPGNPAAADILATATSNKAGGTGTVSLTALYTDLWGNPYSGQYTYSVLVPDVRNYQPVVTPKNDSVTYNEANVSTNYVFVVRNTGDTQATYTLSVPTCTGTENGCSVGGPNPITVNPGQTVTAPVNFTTQGPGQTATIGLHATMNAHGVTFADDGSVDVVSLAPTVVVTPVAGSMNEGTNSSGSYAFNVHNEGTSGQITYTLQVTGCTAPVINCSVPTSVTVAQGADSVVNVSFQTQGTTGTGQISLMASKKFVNTYSSTGTGSVNVSSHLTVSTAFMNNDDQDASLCAASCFAMTASRSTVPYYTLDTPRSVTLAYNGDRAFPRPFIYADVSVTSPPASLQAYHLEVWRNGARLRFTNTDSILVFQAPTSPSVAYRLAGQIDMSSYATGVYPVQVIVTALYSNGGSDVSITNTQLLVVNTGLNTQTSGVAKGWTVAGVPRLYLQSDSSALITDGAGSALYFQKGGGGYTAPNGDYTTLTTSSNGGWVRTSLDNTKVWFGSTGLADSVTDRLGYNTQFAYDASQRLVKIYDPFLIKSVGATRAATVLTYGATGLQTIQEANPVASSGRITNVNVDGSGLLRSVVDPTGKDSTTYGYDTSLRLNAITNSSGHTTTYTYGTSWKLAQITAPPVPIDAGGGSTTMQQPTTLMQPWQSVGVPTAPTGTGGTPATPVLPNTIVAQITDANGYAGSMSVNRWGQPMSSTDPLGNVTQYQRTGIFATTQTIPDGSSTAGVNYYAYSGAYLTMAFPVGSDSVNYHYGVAAQIDSTWGSGTTFQRRFLKSDGRADSVEYDHSANRMTRYTYDVTTKAVSSVTDAAGHTTSYRYDPTFGNLTQTITPGGRFQTLQFDAYGRDTVVIAPGIAAHYTRFDLLNRTVFDSVAGNGGATRMSYPHDTISVTDAKGQVYRTDMNALGWATAQHHPDGTLAPVTNRYDKGGRLTSTTNRRGQMITMTYDALGRVKTRNDPVSGATNLSYSPGGFMTVASNATVKDSTMSLLYCQTSQHSISYACNSDTTVVTMLSNPGKHYTMGNTTPGAFNQAGTSSNDDGTGFTHNFMRNSLGLADSVTLGPLTMKYAYDPYDGLLTTTTLPNTSTRTDQYTTNNEEYNWTYTDTTINPLYRRSYRVDLLGRVTSEQMGYPYTSLASSYQVNHEVAYDSLGHVSQVNWSDQTCMAWPGSNPDSLSADQGWRYLCNPAALFSESYSYDAVGNRTDGGAVYKPGNRLTSVSWATYSYDADGNVISRTDVSTGQLMQFYWDAGSQLDSVLISGGGQPSARVDYRYDPYGRQTLRTSTSGSIERLYLYGAGGNSSNIAKEVDLTTGHTTEYEYSGVDHPTMSVTRDSTGTVLASGTYLMDGLGNVVGITPDATGTEILYDSWGNVETDPTELSTLRFGFKGMLYDETTGLYNARARWYQPDVGRFMSEDPLGLSGGINQYVYAGDDPINASDPSGAFATDKDGSVCSINAESCGDALQMSGSLSGSAATQGFGDLSGNGGGGVTYAGGVSFSSVDWTALGDWASQPSAENEVAAVTADANYYGRPNWVAPGIVERSSFMLNYIDQKGNLHYFNLQDAVFQRDGGGKKTPNGMNATYDVLSWVYDGSTDPNDHLIWARRIPVLSTLIRVGTGPKGFAGSFVQFGSAWGSFWSNYTP